MHKLKHLEGLRGVSAFIVFLAHFIPTFYVDLNDKILDYLHILNIKERMLFETFLRILDEGTLPVFIFWFMSAMVISIKLFDENRNGNNKYLIEVATKRYFRFAIPVFFSSFICFLLIKNKLMYNHVLAETLGHGYSDGWLSLWYNFNPGFIHFVKTSLVEVFLNGNCNYNIALWTMMPELLGSFMCFGLFGIAGRNKYRFLIYILVGIFLGVAGLRDVNYFIYFIFLAGIVWCDALNSSDENVLYKKFIKGFFTSRLFPVALLISSFTITIISDIYYSLPENVYYFFNYPSKAIAFTLLINNFQIFRKLFTIRPLTFMGKISFSFYLLHIPILFSAGIYLYLYGGIISPYKTLIVFVIITALITLCAYFFTKIIDKNAIRISDKIGKYFAS
jgi:peptidoglycan/LPS O-acetylase OafA/YrhL